MSALAPCPFCGGDNGATAYTRDGRFAFCPDCGASSRRAFNGRVDQPSAEERAIAAWNTRARTPLEAELLEALELADAALLGANMNVAVVFRKVRAAIAKAKATP